MVLEVIDDSDKSIGISNKNIIFYLKILNICTFIFSRIIKYYFKNKNRKYIIKFILHYIIF